MTELQSNESNLSALDGQEPSPSAGESAARSHQSDLARSNTILNIPNQITIGRLFLSMVFFAVLVVDNYKALGASRTLWLNVSIGLFVLAAATDFLDGYLARKWNMVSTFGRVADPIVDKVFICGSFVLLVKTCSLIAPWIPVVIISREFLISGLRGFLEGRGIAFGAGMPGKLKMMLQSITIPAVLLHEANWPESSNTKNVVIVLIVATIALTIGSSVQYVLRARRLLKDESSID
jgi:CDP-diacylglycerol--glycerol-3-phosphate 3-phosphatidyltransferase